ncbi:hypothetical protein L798_00381 [Zootermopsis nevadensis]|uniref:Uncharacterized protein n=1 Tax=Zootermopsis nevadensis TaxID=136037 RepID=A0A067RDC1_ZOONE|nr:hypothetical protein L798_00381 [Zootermopsis nevadensis]
MASDPVILSVEQRCMIPPVIGINNKKKHALIYPNIPSAIRPIPHNHELPVPVPPISYTADCSKECSPSPPSDDAIPRSSASQDKEFVPEMLPSTSHRVIQSKLNDLAREIELPKYKAELLGSRIKQWNVLEENVKISCYRVHQIPLQKCFPCKMILYFVMT